MQKLPQISVYTLYWWWSRISGSCLLTSASICVQVQHRSAGRTAHASACAHRHLLVYLVQEGPPDEPGPDQADAEGQRGEVEAAVHSAQRAHGVLLVDEHGDVVLAAALRDGPARTAELCRSLRCAASLTRGVQSTGTAAQGCADQSPSLLQCMPFALLTCLVPTCMLKQKGDGERSLASLRDSCFMGNAMLL